MQAIVTKYLGPTNFKGSRIKATCDAGSVTIGYPHHASQYDAHRIAAGALADKLGWTEENGHGPMIGGGAPGGRGEVFVFAPKRPHHVYPNPADMLTMLESLHHMSGLSELSENDPAHKEQYEAARILINRLRDLIG